MYVEKSELAGVKCPSWSVPLATVNQIVPLDAVVVIPGGSASNRPVASGLEAVSLDNWKIPSELAAGSVTQRLALSGPTSHEEPF